MKFLVTGGSMFNNFKPTLTEHEMKPDVSGHLEITREFDNFSDCS
jgi:hypothetical protein